MSGTCSAAPFSGLFRGSAGALRASQMLSLAAAWLNLVSDRRSGKRRI
jgi:hypothetical protein